MPVPERKHEMNKTIMKIGIIGDYDGRPSHLATDEAIRHCAEYLGIKQQAEWLSTNSLEADTGKKISGYDALWCAPGSPYISAQGAMNAIWYARENDVPFIGTCGGFQHTVLEFARDVLKYQEVGKIDFDPYSPNLFISGLSCSLVGETRTIYISDGTNVSEIYGETGIIERFNCSFGLNVEFVKKLTANGFVVAGVDETGDTRYLNCRRINSSLPRFFSLSLARLRKIHIN